MSDHQHVFPVDRKAKGAVVFCSVDACAEFRVGTGRGLREPTADERISVVARMMEDVAYAEAFSIIHGPERGVQRVREIRGYT